MKKISVFMLLICSAFVIVGCGKKTDNTVSAPVADAVMIANGDVVSVDYTLTLKDGTVKDTSLKEVADKAGLVQTGRKYEPLTFPVGKKQMIPGFEAGIIGMKVGESKKITVTPADGYGERNDKMIQSVSGDVFTKAGITPKIGDTFNFSFAPGKIIAISGDMITIDFNHPLAGETLSFDVKVVNIQKGAGSGAVAPMPAAQ